MSPTPLWCSSAPEYKMVSPYVVLSSPKPSNFTEYHDVHLISVELPYDVTCFPNLKHCSYIPTTYLGDGLRSCYGWYSRSFQAKIRILSTFSNSRHSIGFPMKVVFVRNLAGRARPSFSGIIFVTVSVIFCFL